MDKEIHYRKLENAYLLAKINKFFLPKIRVDEGKAEIIVRIKNKFFHFSTATHGCVYFKCLDDAAYFAIQSLIFDTIIYTSSFNTFIILPIISGEMRAIGTVLNQAGLNQMGKQFLAESVLYNSENQEIGRGIGSYIKSKRPVSEIEGYML